METVRQCRVTSRTSGSQFMIIRAEWVELIEIWRALNRQLSAAAQAVPDEAWSRAMTIANSEPLTLKFVFEDYLKHMLHHLEHIGIEVDDLQPVSSTTV